MASFEVVLSSKAHTDLTECVAFVLRVSKETAQDLANQIFGALGSLAEFPERYPVFNMPKAVSFIVRKQTIGKRYIALFGVEGNKVIVFRILDTRRKCDCLLY